MSSFCITRWDAAVAVDENNENIIERRHKEIEELRQKHICYRVTVEANECQDRCLLSELPGGT
jgi:hypothetical protein